jgi:thiamine-phosphate pyrophosphorylase
MRTIATVAARLNARSRNRGLPVLLAMRDAARLPDPRPFLPGFPVGAALIWRGGAPDAQAAATRARCLCLRIPFLWAGRAGEARALRADGLHLRDDRVFRAAEARAWRRRGGGLLTAAAHDFRGLRDAARLADAVLLSPVFPTRSHPGERAIGITRFRLWARAVAAPVYALGGVTERTARGLLSAPCVGIAGIDWVLSLPGK